MQNGREPRSWPVFLALALVAVLALAMLGIDLSVERHTAAQTSDLVNNSMRSVSLASDLRSHALELATPGLDRGRLVDIVTWLTRDSIAYDPLATSPGERAKWEQLQAQLAELQRRQVDGARPPTTTAADMEGITQTVNELIDINQRDAAANVQSIASLHRRGLIAETVAGTVTVVLAFGIAIALVRALRRERAATQRELELSQERKRELEAFAARVAHDLRGPLSPVRGYADVLADHGPAETRPIGKKLQRGVEKMTAIIEDLLALSTSGEFRVARTPVAPVVRELVEDMHDALADARVELHLAEGVTTCTPSVLSQIIGNLVSNAVKYRAPERPLALSISSETHDDLVEITVADNGRGMDPVTREHVFEPFFRGHDVQGVPGTGLGLAIVKRSVEALHGSCSVDSEPGRGTAVTIRLPAAA